MVGKEAFMVLVVPQPRPGRMERIVTVAVLLLCAALSASAGIFELPIATSKTGVLNFWPRLNASCEMKPLEDNLCCLDSTFKGRSEAHHLLLELLNDVPYPKYEVQGVAQLLHKSSSGLEVGTRYMCDVPLAQEGNEIPGFGCHKCLEEIAHEIASGMSQSRGRCENSWAVRFGYIYEPDIPWEEDTTWCHLDYWFRVLPSDPTTRFWNTFWRVFQQRLRDTLIRPSYWLRRNSLPYGIISGSLPTLRKLKLPW